MPYLFANILKEIESSISLETMKGNNSQMTISRSKYSICSKMNKKSGDDLYSLNSIIDKTNIDLLISNYELKLNDFNQLNVFKWTNDILYEFTLLFSLS